jgi:hypothetical protein
MDAFARLEGMTAMPIRRVHGPAVQYSTAAFKMPRLGAKPPRMYSFYMPDSCSMLGKPAASSRGTLKVAGEAHSLAGISRRAIASYRGLR